MTTAIKPPIGLIGQLTESMDLNYWSEDDGMGDPWIGMPYQWTIKINVTPQMHSSHSASSTYMYYSALDVQEGFWIAELSSGKAVKIISIDIAQTNESQLVCDVEDIDRFNTFSDFYQSGVGALSTFTDVLIFSIGKDGLPVFGPVSQYAPQFSVNTAITADILSHFRYRNLYRDVWRVNQPGHTFSVDDVVYIDSDGNYYLAEGGSKSANKIVGTVSSVGTPGNDWFTVKPIASITSGISPALPGNPGDIIYVDPNNPGKLTNVRPRNGFAMPVYIKLKDSAGLTVDRNVIKSIDNYEAAVDPIQTDDYNKGYGIGSLWINRSTNSIWVCSDDTPGAASWASLTDQKTFKFDQVLPAMIWDIQHNKNNTYFSYTLFDSTGIQVFPDKIEILDANNVRISMTVPMAGKLVFQFV